MGEQVRVLRRRYFPRRDGTRMTNYVRVILTRERRLRNQSEMLPPRMLRLKVACIPVDSSQRTTNENLIVWRRYQSGDKNDDPAAESKCYSIHPCSKVTGHFSHFNIF